jgi:hypothetical protein
LIIKDDDDFGQDENLDDPFISSSSKIISARTWMIPSYTGKIIKSTRCLDDPIVSFISSISTISQ